MSISIEGKKINFESIYINFDKTKERSDNYIIKFEHALIKQSKRLDINKYNGY